MNTEGQMSVGQALLMAVLQGITELFPISSLGHAVVVPHLTGWSIDRDSPTFLPFLVTLHLGTAIALCLYFRADWWALLSGLVSRSDDGPVREQRSLLFLLVLGTIPAGLLGLLLEKRLAAGIVAYLSTAFWMRY